MTTDRYKAFYKLIQKSSPRTVLEIGTFSGHNAIEMMVRADVKNDHREQMLYAGIDVFEEGGYELDKKEINAKAHPPMEEVKKRLEQGFEKRPHIHFFLMGGESKQILDGWKPLLEARTIPGFEGIRNFDFIYIDGGHSVETIMSDLDYAQAMIEPGGWIVLDDYYEPNKDFEELIGEPFEEWIEKYGCNSVVDSFSGSAQFSEWERRDLGTGFDPFIWNERIVGGVRQIALRAPATVEA